MDSSSPETLTLIPPSTFETLIPRRYVKFTTENMNPIQDYLEHSKLSISMIDSDLQDDGAIVIALIVPQGLEYDWSFCTHHGLLKCLIDDPEATRLFAVSNNPLGQRSRNFRPSVSSEDIKSTVVSTFTPFLLGFCPSSAFPSGAPNIRFIFADEIFLGLVGSILHIDNGDSVGGFIVEEIELKSGYKVRRLRFLRSPYLTQSQMCINADSPIGDAQGQVQQLDTETCFIRYDLTNVPITHESIIESAYNLHLVPVWTSKFAANYLDAMVASLTLISNAIDSIIEQGLNPKALCLGVGGGTLVTFLIQKLGFNVTGVEVDDAILEIAQHYFEMPVDSQYVELVFDDAIKYIETQAEINGSDEGKGDKFDVVMVDLDAHAPNDSCLEFASSKVLNNTKKIIAKGGILVIHVDPTPRDLASFYALVDLLKPIYTDLYKIEYAPGYFVLIAAPSSVEVGFQKKLRTAISGVFMGPEKIA